MSHRAPGYRFQYQVPPTSSAASTTLVEKPSCRRRWSKYSPENPAPTTTTSTSAATMLDPFSPGTVWPPPLLRRPRVVIRVSAVSQQATVWSNQRTECPFQQQGLPACWNQLRASAEIPSAKWGPTG